MNRLKELRKKNKTTQKQIANLLGVSEMTISRWENETELSIKHEYINKLSDYFNVNADYLLGYADEPHKTMEDLAQQNPEHFTKDKDGILNFTLEGFGDALSEDANRYFYIENIIDFVKDKETTNKELCLLSELVNTFKNKKS